MTSKTWQAEERRWRKAASVEKTAGHWVEEQTLQKGIRLLNHGNAPMNPRTTSATCGKPEADRAISTSYLNRKAKTREAFLGFEGIGQACGRAREFSTPTVFVESRCQFKSLRGHHSSLLSRPCAHQDSGRSGTYASNLSVQDNLVSASPSQVGSSLLCR